MRGEDRMMRQINVGKEYLHFKGNKYLVLAIAKHSETDEPYVVYKALYGDHEIYVRPYAMFASEVDIVKYPEARQKFRFEELDCKSDCDNQNNQDQITVIE